MNVRKMCLSLSVGLVFIVVLSMSVMPALATAEEGFLYHKTVWSSVLFEVSVTVEGEWDAYGVLLWSKCTFYTSPPPPFVTVLDQYSVSNSQRVYGEITVITWTGTTVRISTWITPTGSSGGSCIIL
jgi:hypothetical protein